MASQSDDNKKSQSPEAAAEEELLAKTKSSVPPFERRERTAGAVVGAIAGAVVGAFAGPPGLIAGSALGAAVGAAAGAALDRVGAERDRRDKELDEEIGITRGNMGAFPVTMPPPPAPPTDSFFDLLEGELASTPNLPEDGRPSASADSSRDATGEALEVGGVDPFESSRRPAALVSDVAPAPTAEVDGTAEAAATDTESQSAPPPPADEIVTEVRPTPVPASGDVAKGSIEAPVSGSVKVAAEGETEPESLPRVSQA
jgi:hypothetical protein